MNTVTQQCPHCGTPNEIGLARCANCQSPLTAYAGQITGLGESARGRLSEHVQQLDVRPPVIGAMTIFNILVALFWPLASVIGAFQARPVLKADGTNYIGAAIGTIGPFFTAILCIPLALALLGIAWGTWTQQPWAWKANGAAVIGFLLFTLTPMTGAPLKILWLAVAGALAYLWFAPRTKAWFGMN